MSAVPPDYASASWEDGESIPEISLDNTVVPGKYKATVSNILSKHCAEVRNLSDEIVQPVVNVSKKKLKELISKHNNEIFAFMARPDKTPHTLGLAEMIFRRYGHDIPSIKGSSPNTVLRDLNLDASMNSVVADFDEGLKKQRGGGGLDDFMRQTRWMYNQYKNVGEEVLRLETVLFQKIDMLDKLNNRIPLITSLGANDALPDLVESFAKYAENIYKSNNFEDTYKELIEAYKKWNICRQIISSNNAFKNDAQEAQCSICLTEAISMAIVPCGHTFCGSCAKKQNTNCYICRGTIRERVKLFFT
ncbi:MAG: RING-HC finger protein [Terrimicrobiaceae bacterium]